MLSDLLELRQLRYFVGTIEAGTMSEAARRFEVSQPAMSLAINELEKKLGKKLLTRGRRGVEPTEAGLILLHHSERLLQEESKLREQFNSSNTRSSKISFGMIPTLAPYLLPLLMRDFRMRHPGVDIQLSENRTPDLIKSIANNEIEFAILSDVTKEDRQRYGLHTKPLFKEPLMLALPISHSWAKRAEDPKPSELHSDTLIQLSDGHCLRDQTLKACQLKNAQTSMQCDQLDTALAMVEANLGMAIIPKLAVRNNLSDRISIRSFNKPAPTRQICLLKKEDHQLSDSAEHLIKVLVNDSWQS